jgi:hypothetical protein
LHNQKNKSQTVTDLVNKLDEELSPIFSGQNALEFCAIISPGSVHVSDRLALVNSPLGFRISLRQLWCNHGQEMVFLISVRGEEHQGRGASFQGKM